MPAPVVGYLICSMALVGLIFLLPFFYDVAVSNLRANMFQRELQEVSNYVANTFEELYFLANSTNCMELSLEKELLYMPPTIEDSTYLVSINESAGSASGVTAYLKDRASIAASAWLAPGLKRGKPNSIESGGRTVVAGCSRNASGVYVWITSR